MSKPKRTKLSIFNDALTIAIILMGFYIILLPFLPNLTFWWNNRFNKNVATQYQTNLTPPDEQKPDLPAPPNRHLIIPALQIDREVFEGKSASTLNKGIWRRPKTSTPDKGGNTVLAAHRFTYKSPEVAVFYHLDKLKIGDRFALTWDGFEYNYEIFEILVVEPTAIEIEDNTEEPMVTLYTCTPMWTAKQRLVVKAKQVSKTPIKQS